MIEVKNLTKKYGDHVAVDHLSFTIESGQIYGFLGPNGAGKSTTMNIMTGYLGATEGEVLINGCDILEEPEQAKRFIGYLPELPPLYMDMTVDEYLEFAAQLKKIPRLERKEAIRKAKETAKIEDVSRRLIKNLSKGYKQRVGLAQAVLGFPEIIILDEPTVGLDPKQIIEIRDVIRDLGKKHTVILSSHILSEVSAVCDHIMIISKGKLVASDTPDNLTALMEGTRTLSLCIKGTKSRIEEVLSGQEQIDKISVSPSKEPEALEITLQVPKDVDLREQLFYAFADARMPILMMKSDDMSLEDVFLELTGTTDAQSEAQAVESRPESEKITEDDDGQAAGIAPESGAEAEFEGESEEGVDHDSNL